MGFSFKIGYSFDDRLVPNHRPADVEQRRSRWWRFEWWAAESLSLSAKFYLLFWPGWFYLNGSNSCCRQHLGHYRIDIKPGGKVAAVNELGRAQRLQLLMLSNHRWKPPRTGKKKKIIFGKVKRWSTFIRLTQILNSSQTNLVESETYISLPSLWFKIKPPEEDSFAEFFVNVEPRKTLTFAHQCSVRLNINSSACCRSFYIFHK